MRFLIPIVAALAATTSAGCRPAVDTRAAADALLQRDKAWAAAAASSTNVDSIVGFWSANALVMMPGAPTLRGTAAISAMVKSSLASPGFHISWVPDSAIVATSGDLGYTFGTNTMTMADSAGRSTTEHGRYVTIWAKEADGQWRCIVDTYNSGPPASAQSS